MGSNTQPRYTVREGWIVGRHLDRPLCANRALYCGNTDVQVLAGDLPVIRLSHGRQLLGTLRLFWQGPAGRRYLHEAQDITMAYRANQVVWTIQDAALPAPLTLTIGVPGDAHGYVLRISAAAGAPALQMGWQYGGMQTFAINPGSGENGWNLDIVSDPQITLPDLLLEGAPANHFAATEDGWRCWAQPEAPVTLCPPEGDAGVTDGGWLEGDFTLEQAAVFFTVAQGEIPAGEAAFAAAEARTAWLQGRVVSRTPDAYLDAAMAVLPAEVDGAWYPPRTMHSTQIYNMPFLGWCNRFGNAYLGWSDRLAAELAYYAVRQNGPNGKTGDARDAAQLGTVMDQSSRFYGEGHIDTDQNMYNMQSQFFDQMITAWRMGGDALEDWLYPALEKHTRWQDACFDPDEDGLYESYINTWPTDSVWYNGGGSCEETCYAYTAHQAAAELAARHGDEASAAYHQTVLARIRKGFFEKLWIADKGYPGMMVEKGGHGRLHQSAWQYNSFLPVNAGMLDPLQAAMAVWYSNWGLENVALPYGGRTVWMSNWVPSVWSVRKIGGGENFQQAYAFFAAGFADEGYDLLRGHMMLCDFNDALPGGACSETGSLLARAVVGGLHGYQPDYPNGRVVLTPQYPTDWDTAALHTDYLQTQYRRTENTLCYHFTLARAAQVTVRLPVRCDAIQAVQGAVAWRLLPGFGCTVVELELGLTNAGDITLTLGAPWHIAPSQRLQAAPTAALTLQAPDAVSVEDPQQILQQATVGPDGVRLVPKDISGTHIVFLTCRKGEMLCRQLVQLDVSPTAAELERRRKEQCLPAATGERYLPLPLGAALTDDVRTIFKQYYNSPRPAGVHLSIGTDGFSPWTFTYWAKKVPEVQLDAAQLTPGQVVSPRGIPFAWGGTHNIAFTSLWDNWPTAVSVPVDRQARRIYLLLAGSTNPMQCHIANAVCRFTYTDGTQETLSVEPPRNFWALCGYEGEGMVAGQEGTNDYDYTVDSFCLPADPPEMIRLGDNCRAMVLSWELPAGKTLAAVTLEALSQEVVIGLAGITLLVAEEETPA